MKKLPASYRPLSLAQPAGSARTGRTASSWDEFVAALLDMSGKDLITVGEFGESSVGANKVVTITAPFKFERTVEIDTGLSGLVVKWEGFCPVEPPEADTPFFRFVSENCILTLSGPVTATPPAPLVNIVESDQAGTAVVVNGALVAYLAMDMSDATVLINGALGCAGLISITDGELTISGCAACSAMDIDCGASVDVHLGASRLGDITLACDESLVVGVRCQDLTVSGDNGQFSSVVYSTLNDTGVGNLYGP